MKVKRSSMSIQDRIRWDNIFRSRHRAHYPAPDPLLLQCTPPAQQDSPDHKLRALDLAAGLGQNGIWLAEQGYATDIMDISRVALQRARAEMGMRNLRNINIIQKDIDNLSLDPAQYDVICVFRYLKRRIFPLVQRATKPGGRVIYETFNTRYLQQVPQFNPEFLLKPGELRDHFAGWQILFDEEVDHLSQLVAVKTRA